MATAQNALVQSLSFIFGSEKALHIRRFSININEAIAGLQTKDKAFDLMFSGSKGEGVAYPLSDDDTMFVYKAPYLRVRTRLGQANQHNAPLMVPSERSPGYCLLWIPDMRRHRYGFCCNNNYLSSLQWKLYLMQENIDLFPVSSLHGPCHSGFANNSVECDIAHTLKCSDWPEIASEWIYRVRKHGWPSHDTIQYIASKGCHVVPVGDPESRDADLEWRISFSFAERTLAHTFTHIHFVIYNFLKLILKRIINVHVPDTFCSYFIKTTLFYCIERSDRALWCSDHIDACYKRCITMLHNFVDVRYCPSYFVNKTNLFKRKITVAKRRQLIPVLDMLLENGIRGALLLMQESIILSENVSNADIETKDDINVIKNHLPNIELQIDYLYTVQGKSVQNLILTHADFMDILHACASRTLLPEQKQDMMLLLYRFCCVQIAVCVNKSLMDVKDSNRGHYRLRQLMVRMYTLGIRYDISLGRLRFATYLYVENLTTEAQKLLQDIMSSMSPYVQIKDRKNSDKSYLMYREAICNRGYSFARKHGMVVAEVVHFSPTDYKIIPTALQFLTINNGQICRHCFLDPLFYAFFLQGLCFIKERDISSANNSIRLLQEQLLTAKFIDKDGLESVSQGFCLLGHLQMQLERYDRAGYSFITAVNYAHKYYREIGSKKIYKTDYAMLYLSVLLGKILAGY